MRKRITIVWTGNQDARLLTMRAVDALASAGAVIVDAELEDIARATCKGGILVLNGGSLAQRTRAVRDALKEHSEVVRFLAGDPVLDGVLAQELHAYEVLGQVVVVPGVTTSTVAATFAGVSLTGQRVREVRMIDAADPATDWTMPPRETLIVKGLAGAAKPALEALRGGDRNTAFRIVSGAGSVAQVTIAGTLGEFDALVDIKRLAPDSIMFIGEPVREAVDWFERLPLIGWHLLMPRTKDALSGLTALLERDGAITTHIPTLSVEPPRTPQQIERAVTGLVEGRYGWVIFTCANAFIAVWEKCREYGLDARVFAGTRIAAVGEDTVVALASRGMHADLVHPETTQSLVEMFPPAEAGTESVSRILIPRAEIATETLASGLVELGWEADEVTVYRTVRSAPPAAATREAIKSGAFQAVVFTSSATVRNLIGLAGKPHASTVVACIGPTTARAAEEHGLRVDVVAAEPTHEALAQALIEFAEARRASDEGFEMSVPKPGRAASAAPARRPASAAVAAPVRRKAK